MTIPISLSPAASPPLTNFEPSPLLLLAGAVRQSTDFEHKKSRTANKAIRQIKFRKFSIQNKTAKRTLNISWTDQMSNSTTTRTNNKKIALFFLRQHNFK